MCQPTRTLDRPQVLVCNIFGSSGIQACSVPPMSGFLGRRLLPMAMCAIESHMEGSHLRTQSINNRIFEQLDQIACSVSVNRYN